MAQTAINTCTWNGYAKHTDTEMTFEGFLSDVAAAGYDGVEISGTFIADPMAAKEALAKHGLVMAAGQASVTYNPWQPATDNFITSCQATQAMGVDKLMVCGGFMGNQRRNTGPADYDMFGGNMAEHIKIAADHGLTICYHPHRGCVVETANETALLIERVPDLQLCVDTAHLAACFDDAAAFIKRFADRIAYTHLKDFSWASDHFHELGEGGDCDVAACIQALKDIDYQGWYTVELDKKFEEGDSRSALESAKISRAFMAKHGI